MIKRKTKQKEDQTGQRKLIGGRIELNITNFAYSSLKAATASAKASAERFTSSAASAALFALAQP
jgi:hypothetical protein